MNKNKRTKGFTLAELLIVVAIIGVLVGISIPIFTNQLERSRDAVSVANIRSAYALAMSEYITCRITDSHTDNLVHSHLIKDESGTRTINFRNGRIVQICIFNVEIKSKKNNDWSGLGASLPFHDTMKPGVYGDSGISGTTRWVVFNFDDYGNGQGSSNTGENWNDIDVNGSVTSVEIVYGDNNS